MAWQLNKIGVNAQEFKGLNRHHEFQVLLWNSYPRVVTQVSRAFLHDAHLSAQGKGQAPTLPALVCHFGCSRFLSILQKIIYLGCIFSSVSFSHHPTITIILHSLFSILYSFF
ncbi:hypothetical protein EYC84_012042 [Monilinia fructicola]|uniref:Uncharacterized protein n=1 Tax=Monilinia fructicola TaxID=38448 RepID=A0A5M9J6H5_MONFR|nr:hypothetical protein EYC84_012042 [Monilinia fructicola]